MSTMLTMKLLWIIWLTTPCQGVHDRSAQFLHLSRDGSVGGDVNLSLGCQFVAHRPGDREAVESGEGASRVLFKQGGAAVVEAPPMRYLVSFAGDGRCYEQAEVTCAQDANTSSSESSSGACSGAELCHRIGGGDALLSYLKSMAGGALANGPPQSVAVLGFGSGALAAWLVDTFPDTTVDSVDLDADVIAAAPCFGVNPSNRLSLTVQDGRSFLEGSSGGYSAIFVDAFDGSGHMPGCMATVEFFALARDKLQPDDGVLAVNLGFAEEVSPIIAAIKKAFLNVAVGHAPHETNTIVIASQLNLAFDASWGESIDQQVASQVRSWAQAATFKPADDSAAQPRTDAASMCGV